MIYDQGIYELRVNGGVQGKIDILVDKQDTLNAAARELFTKIDLRSSIRRAVLSPNLFNGIFPYFCPTDLKAYGIIDFPSQAHRTDGEWAMTTPEEFERTYASYSNYGYGYSYNGGYVGYGNYISRVAIDDYNGVRVLLLNSGVDSQSVLVSELDSLTSGNTSGSWTLFGDATSVAVDNADYVKGNGSLKFNLSAAGGTTAGIQSSTVNSVNITDYLGGTSAFFVWVKINSATNLTNYILRFGTNSSNYYSKTVTTQADGTAFVAGWNLLKFDVASYSTTGTPTNTTLNYFVLYMTKTAGKISETDYKFDWLILKKGVVNYIKYYSKYPWQTSGGSYIENSTSTTDLLNADTDEFDLIVKQGIVNARREIGFLQSEIDASETDLLKAIKNYEMKNPSQAKLIMTDYYEY